MILYTNLYFCKFLFKIYNFCIFHKIVYNGFNISKIIKICLKNLINEKIKINIQKKMYIKMETMNKKKKIFQKKIQLHEYINKIQIETLVL
jgi:hypothetical protein